MTYTLHCGRAAADELERSALMDHRRDLPMPEPVVKRLVASTDGFCVIGYADETPVGYIAGQLQIDEYGQRRLFLYQAVTHGKPAWSRGAYDFLRGIAQHLGCATLATTIPMDKAHALQRRYGFLPQGVLMVKFLHDVEG